MAKRPRHANKRSEEEKEHDRKLATRLKLQGDMSSQDISDYIFKLTSRRISPRQVRYDIDHVRERWIREQIADYNMYINKELARLDALENELWESWRASKQDSTQERVEKVAKKVRDEHEGEVDDDELVKIMVDKIVTTTTSSVGSAKFLELIFKAQQERRKLLGLYAPARLDIREERTLNIKGYTTRTSPDVWPDHDDDVVEGEYSHAGQDRKEIEAHVS